jgi:hypothetical protein
MLNNDNIIFLKWLLIGILLAIAGGTLLHYGLVAMGVPYTARIVIANIMGCLIAVFCMKKIVDETY